MNEIKCPKCGNVFQVDEADYASIVNQVRNKEFQQEIARRMAEQVLFLKGGRLVEQGETGQVLSHPRCAETQAFLDFYAL